MDLPVNHFKRAITAGRTPVGTWLSSASPSTAEALGCAGFDFLVVDTEHTPLDVPQMVEILRTIAGTPAQAIVRPPWNDMVMIKRALDAGAQTLLLPFVQNADEAKRAVANARYPPKACAASPGRTARSRFGTDSELPQDRRERALRDRSDRDARRALEPGSDCRRPRHRLDLRRAERSRRVDGPLGDMGNAAVQAKLAFAAKECRRLGKPCGIVGGNPEIVAQFLDYGYSWVAVASDMAMMVSRAQEFLTKVRAAIG